MWHIYSPRQSKNILSLIDTGRKVCGAGSTKLLGVRPSVPSFGCCTALQRSSLLPWARRAGDIHRLLHGPANSSKCEQRHVVSWQRLVLHSEQSGAVPNYLTYMRTIIRPHGIDAAYCYNLTYRGPCVPVSRTQASCAKMTEPIGMPFIEQIRVGSKNQWSRSPEALWGGGKWRPFDH